MKKWLSGLLAAVMVLAGAAGVPQVFAAETETAPAIDWRADIAGKQLKDYGASGADIDLSENTAWSDAGTSFKGMDGITFSAANAVQSTDLKIWNAINGATGVTVSAAVKVLGNGGTVIKLTPTNAALGLSVSSGKLRVEARSQNGDSYKVYETASALLDYGTDASWHQVDVTLDYTKKEIKYYVDNKLCETIATDNWGSETLSYSPSDKYNVAIGNTTIVLAQLRLYNQALTEEEITGRFAPVWSCDFDELSQGAAPGTVSDTSGYGVSLNVPSGAEVVSGMMGNTVQLASGSMSNTSTLSVNNRLDGAKTVTVSFWQKYTGETDPTDYVLNLKGGGNSLIAVKPISNTTYVMVRSYGAKVDNVAESSNWTAVTTNSGLGDGAWHHILFEANYADGTAVLYQDGVEIQAKSNLSTHYQYLKAANSAELHIGNQNVLLDNVKIYSKALTQTEREELLAEHPVLQTKMVDAEGNETENVQEMAKIICTVTNLKSTPMSCVLVGAGYTDTEEGSALMLDLDMEKDITIGANRRQTVELTDILTGESLDAGVRLKIFLLDSLDNLIPLEVPQEFTGSL